MLIKKVLTKYKQILIVTNWQSIKKSPVRLRLDLI